jgi:ABC-type transport system involved in cytochrome c biogenesis permease component
MTRPAVPSAFLAVLRKELTDTLRDRRTLIAMIVVPLLLFPVLPSASPASPARAPRRPATSSSPSPSPTR